MLSSRILIVITFLVIGILLFIKGTDGQRPYGGQNRPYGGQNGGPYGGPNRRQNGGQRRRPNTGPMGGQNGGPRMGNGGPMRGPIPNMQSPNGNLPPNNANDPSLNGNDPSLNGISPTPNGNLSPPNGNVPTLNGNNPTLNGNNPAVNGNTPSLTGNNPVPDGNIPTPAGNSPTLAGSIPTPAGNSPTLAGTNPTLAGSIPTPAGNIPTPAGNVPTPNSSVSPPSGLDDLDIADLKKNIKSSVLELSGRIKELLTGTKVILGSIKSNFVNSLTGPDMLDGLGRLAMNLQTSLSTVGDLVNSIKGKGLGAIGSPDTKKSVDKLQDQAFNTLAVAQALLDQVQSTVSDTLENFLGAVGAITDAAKSPKLVKPAQKLLKDFSALTTGTLGGVLSSVKNLQSSFGQLRTTLETILQAVPGLKSVA